MELGGKGRKGVRNEWHCRPDLAGFAGAYVMHASARSSWRGWVIRG